MSTKRCDTDGSDSNSDQEPSADDPISIPGGGQFCIPCAEGSNKGIESNMGGQISIPPEGSDAEDSDQANIVTGDGGDQFCMPCAEGSDDDMSSIASTDRNEQVKKLMFPLQQWLVDEGHKSTSHIDVSLRSQLNLKRAGLLRKLTVAFAIGKVLEHIKASVSSYSQDELLQMCSADNFAVHMMSSPSEDDSSEDDEGWEVTGVDMISPPMSLQVASNSFNSSNFFSSTDEGECWGSNTSVAITKHSPFCCAKKSSGDERRNEKHLCYALGLLIKIICDDGSSGDTDPRMNDGMGDLLRSLSISPFHPRPTKSTRMPSQYQEVHTSCTVATVPVSRVINDLLNSKEDAIKGSNNCYTSLGDAIEDIHHLLAEPMKYLFNSNHQLPISTNMYGRTSETKSLLDAFCRVASSGQSEAFVIAGFSGSGKTRLVESVTGSVHTAGGLIVKKKFEQNSTNQLSLVLSAFNDMCVALKESGMNTEFLWRNVLSEFGSYVHMLIQTLPYVTKLAPSAAAQSLSQGIQIFDVNFFSLCDIIKRFMRAISISSHPIMLVLDDLQWCGPVSLGLVHAVLSDIKGASCLFVVGSYRDNEVSQDHIIHGFKNWLISFNVPYDVVYLGGMTKENVLSLVSDALGMLPRQCQSLAQVVYCKTRGNPLFVQTFLRSLVDDGLLTYSLRERCWAWDIDEIRTESGVTPNVLKLLSTKIAHLSESSQTALKVASCFGIQIDASIVKTLSGTPRYSSLAIDLNKAVEDGMLDLDPNGSKYRFVHDKVREAALGLISPNEKSKFHFELGMLLLSSFDNLLEEEGEIFFYILDQINHGVPLLVRGDEESLSIAKLNHEAASRMLQSYNYTDAYNLVKGAISLLPDDSWNTHYDLSLQCTFLLARAAYSNRKIDEAKKALNNIIKHVSTLQTKVDAYALQCSVLFNACAPKELNQILTPIATVLNSLGQKIPDAVSVQEVERQVLLVTSKFEEEPDSVLINLSTNAPDNYGIIMQAYSILTALAYVAAPKLFPYFASRWCDYCLKHKASSKYIPAAYVTFAVVLCRDLQDTNRMQFSAGRRIGKLGMRMLDQCDSSLSELPKVHLAYYGHVGCLFEPVQACVDMHMKAYDIAQQIGNNSMAALHKQFLIARQLHSGTSLVQLKDELDRDIKMTEYVYALPHLAMKIRVFYKAVVDLIGTESSMSPQEPNSESAFDQELATLITKLMTSTYLGFYERASHLYKRWEELGGDNQSKKMISFRSVYVYFYCGLAAIGLQKKKKSKSIRSRVVTTKWLDVLNNAAACSPWNWRNKAALLMAERYSILTKNDQAEQQYDIAISFAKSSRFIHEEGLACELAGVHYENMGDDEKAYELFNRAEQCYDLWGSIVKSQQMEEKVRQLNGRLHIY